MTDQGPPSSDSSLLINRFRWVVLPSNGIQFLEDRTEDGGVVMSRTFCPGLYRGSFSDVQWEVERYRRGGKKYTSGAKQKKRRSLLYFCVVSYRTVSQTKEIVFVFLYGTESFVEEDLNVPPSRYVSPSRSRSPASTTPVGPRDGVSVSPRPCLSHGVFLSFLFSTPPYIYLSFRPSCRDTNSQ